MRVVVDVARVVLAAYFLFSGYNHLANLGSMAQYAASKKVPAPGFMVFLTGLMLLAGGASLLLGYQVTAGALVLAVFLVPVAVWMHGFWSEQDPMARGNQMAHFGKNIALAAAVLMLTAVGHWAW
jgi:putative oxidoreductase